MSVANIVRKKVKSFRIGTIFTYSDIYNLICSDYLDKNYIRTVVSRLVDEKLIKRVNDGIFKRIPSDCYKIFVYGSLKKNFSNHQILEDARYNGKAVSVKKFALFEHDSGNYPCLVETQSKKAKKIEGEIFEVTSNELLARIDYFEGAPDNYERKRVKVKKGKKVEIVETYIYTSTYIPEHKEFFSKWEEKNKKSNMEDYIKFLKTMIK